MQDLHLSLNVCGMRIHTLDWLKVFPATSKFFTHLLGSCGWLPQGRLSFFSFAFQAKHSLCKTHRLMSRCLPTAGGHCRQTDRSWQNVTDVVAILQLQVACPPSAARLRLRTCKVLAWQHLDLGLACLRKPDSDSDGDLARIGLSRAGGERGENWK